MRISPLRTLLVGGAIVAGSASLMGHVRLHVPSNGNSLFWSTPSNVGIVINSTGSDDISDGSHVTAIRNAIDVWNRASGSSLQLVEDADPAQMLRTDWESDSVHLVMFDEDNSSGFFPGSSQTVAITPIWFFTSGQISDADVLYNGKDFQFTTQGTSGRFDVADVGAHELGHLIGLDHSGCCGATMFPYVDSTVILHRSLSADDAAGVRDAYPSSSFGQITGTVRRESDSSAVAGAYLVALDADGRVAGGALAENDGTYAIAGLDPGTYSVYATPLDEPVSETNLSAGHTVESDFEPAFAGSTAVITGGNTVALGDLEVGADVSVSLGRSSDPLPLRAVAGSTVTRSLRGVGLSAGSTLTASDPAVSVSVLAWLGSQVSFQVTTPPGADPGHVDLVVTTAVGDQAILPGALEITPTDPTVTNVTPVEGGVQGGTLVTVTGTGFNAGARVVLGDQIYVDGEVGGAVVQSATTITLTTRATIAGLHDAVVIDETGVEGRMTNAFSVVDNPTIDTIFPPAGDASGGTQLVLRGDNFLTGLSVRIDGADQSSVLVDSNERVVVTTDGGLPGGPYDVEIENPGGGIATASFVYVPQLDPEVTSVSPASGTSDGGETITITGSGFTADSEVVFGADPDTGAGGTAAASVVFVDSSTLQVQTPAHSVGATSVMVCDGTTAQADVLASGFTFQGAGGGGGGGGCVAGSFDGTFRLRDVLAGSWWLALIGLVLLVRRGPKRELRPARARIRDSA